MIQPAAHQLFWSAGLTPSVGMSAVRARSDGCPHPSPAPPSRGGCLPDAGKSICVTLSQLCVSRAFFSFFSGKSCRTARTLRPLLALAPSRSVTVSQRQHENPIGDRP